MHRSLRLTAMLLAIAVVGGAAGSADRAKGYLDPGEFDVTHVLEPAPRPGDPRYDADRKIFRATRALAGSPRWVLATADVETGAPAMLRDFSCAAGVALTPDNAPKLVALVQRAGADTGAQTAHAKDVYQRLRPFQIDRGPICQPQSELFDQKVGRISYDYPSGHTTWGWTWALILAGLAPDRAQAILERGRVYGDSRFICGAHNESAVEGGFLSASATMAVVATKPAYQSDRAAAKAELDALRAHGPAPSDCATGMVLVHGNAKLPYAP